jgi:hypothetical protein
VGQKTLSTDYVIDDWVTISQELADLGMSVVITGYFHAQDVVKTSTENGNFLFYGLTSTYMIDVVLRGMIPDMLVHLGFPEEAFSFVEPYIPLIGLTFVAHYQGDEELTPETCCQSESGVQAGLESMRIAACSCWNQPGQSTRQISFLPCLDMQIVVS